MTRIAAALAVSTTVLAGVAHAADPSAAVAPEYLDLSEERLAAVRALGLPDDAGPLRRLDAVLAAGSPFRFLAGPLVVYTDPRWLSSLPPDGPGAPLMELRRWPGDSVMTLYAVAGPLADTADRPPRLADATLRLESSGAGRSFWNGTYLDARGERPVWWVERAIEGSDTVLGAALFPGDAGLGASGIPGRTQEMLHLLTKVEVRPGWSEVDAVPRDVDLQAPSLGDPPGDKSEDDDPWQVVRGPGYTIGMPPGFRAIATVGGVRAPRPVEGQTHWFRGTFVDDAGDRVRVGDRTRAGYVARVDGVPDEAWHRAPPAAVVGDAATLRRTQAFPLLAERSHASDASAARFTEDGWDGAWLVFRMRFENAGFEIGLPVVEGARSPSLYWIPLTWRDAARPPAPPPVDPADRFGIRFERLRPLERRQRPFVEGTLDAPGVTLDVPRGWFPAASLRSDDGFPVRFLDSEGWTVGRLERLSAVAVAELRDDASRGWEPESGRGTRLRAGAWSDPAGALLVVGRDGDGFLLQPDEQRQGNLPDLWRQLRDSLRLRRR